jgi:hypothetical protein
MKRFTVALIGSLLLSFAAHAWPACSGNWIQVPAGTSNANGAVVTENGQTFQCQKPTPTPTPTATNTNTNSNANSNTNSASSASNSASNSASSASSNQSQKQQQNQTQTANGGSASSLSNATGGASNSTASASNNGNGSNNSTYSNTTNVAAPKIPVATALAPETLPTSPCYKTYSGAGQAQSFGFSFGGGKVDKGCDDRETARLFAVAGNRIAFAKVMCDTPAAKRAHLTLEECAASLPAPVAVPIVQAPAPAPVPNIIVNVPAPVVITEPAMPVASNNSGTLRDVGTCKLYYGKPTNVCYRILDDAVIALRNNTAARLVLVGPMETSKVLPYLAGKIDRSRVELHLDDDANNNLTVQTWSVE